MKPVILFVALLIAASFATEINFIPDFGVPYTPTYSGYISTNADNIGQAYYLFVESESSASTAPIVLWFSGAPGCSSMRGAFYDIGPYEVKLTAAQNETIVERKSASWTKFANLLFIDAPVGEGYSYFADTPTSRFPDSLKAAAQQTANVLLTWYSTHRNTYRGPIYFAGENFGAKYAQTVSDLLRTSVINVKGLIFGNPWIDPAVQHQAWVEHSYHSGVIGLGQRISLSSQVAECKALIQEKQYERAYLNCWSILSSIKNQTGIDTNDFIERSNNNDFTHIEQYLDRADVRNAFNVNPGNTATYKFCNKNIFSNLIAEIQQSTTSLLENDLNTKKVFIYNGERDIATNTFGVKQLLYNELNWHGRSTFNFANSQTITHYGASVGNFVQGKNLTYAIFYGAAADTAKDEGAILVDVVSKWMNHDDLCTAMTCTVPVASCPNKCSNHGTCNSGICACEAGWSGDDCSQGDKVIDAKNGIPKFNGYVYARSWNEIVMYVPDYSIYFKVLETQFVAVTVTLEQTSTTGDLWIFGTPYNASTPVPSGQYTALNNTRLSNTKSVTLVVPPKTYIRVGVYNNAESEEGSYSMSVVGVADHEAGKIISDIVGLNFFYGTMVGFVIAIVLVILILFIRCILRCRKRAKRGRRFEDDDL